MQVVSLIFMVFVFIFSANAHEYKNDKVFIDHPWMKIIQDRGAGYLSIKNLDSNKSLKIIAAESNRIKNIEIHNIIMENDVMRMRPVLNGVEVKPGAELEFKPGSYHLMFFGIDGSYVEGDLIDIRLLFEGDMSIDVKFKVDTIKSSNHQHSH